MNILRSQQLLQEIHARGVREVVFCAGARNSPVVAVLEKTAGLRLHSFFEERSASFFALGRARATGRPVAVVTTSGTAAAELLPATVEAYYSGVPLVLITADRPRRLRHTGAPQVINQIGLFKNFVETELDLEGGDRLDLGGWTQAIPVHINVCFDEPLLDAPVEALELGSEASEDGPSASAAASPVPGILQQISPKRFAQKPENVAGLWDRVSEFVTRARNPMVVVGTLESESERTAVREVLLRWGVPVYLEGPSGLREDRAVRELALNSGDRICNWALAKAGTDAVIRVGGVPTVRVWRDLDEAHCPAQVLSISRLPFAGLSRGTLLQTDIAELFRHGRGLAQPHESSRPELRQALWSADRRACRVIEELLAAEPGAEPALVRALSREMASTDLVYVGNSLPIREWDLAADREIPRAVLANRGVNGIDGQLSTFLGLCQPDLGNWCIVGDLTAMYDLTAPWALPLLDGAQATFVVINNGGGKIFSRIFGNSLFENRHELRLKGWAEMWGMDYELRLGTSPEPGAARSQGAASRGRVIEIVPDAEATRRFWDQYDSLWRTL